MFAFAHTGTSQQIATVRQAQLQGRLVDVLGLATLDCIEWATCWVLPSCVCLPCHGQVIVFFVGELILLGRLEAAEMEP